MNGVSPNEIEITNKFTASVGFQRGTGEVFLAVMQAGGTKAGDAPHRLAEARFSKPMTARRQGAKPLHHSKGLLCFCK